MHENDNSLSFFPCMYHCEKKKAGSWVLVAKQNILSLLFHFAQEMLLTLKYHKKQLMWFFMELDSLKF